MTVTCAGCGKGFEAKRSTAKFCTPTCRKRGNRRGKADEKKATELADASEQTFSTGLVQQVRSKLEKAKRLDTVAGAQALLLAERMTSPFETGSGVAALSKQLQVVLAEALDGVKVESDPVDELEAKRLAKIAQAQGTA